MNFAVILSEIAARRAEKPAVVSRSSSVTYGELWRGIERFAYRLKQAGVSPGDRVAIALPNSASFLEALFGSFLAEAVAAPIRYEYLRHEVAHIVGNAKPKVIVFDAAWGEARPSRVVAAGNQRRGGGCGAAG